MGRTLSSVVPTPTGPSDVWRSSLPLRVQCDEFVKSMKKSQTSWTGREITIVTSIRTIAGLHRFGGRSTARSPAAKVARGGRGAPAGRRDRTRRVDAGRLGGLPSSIARLTSLHDGSRRDRRVGLERPKAYRWRGPVKARQR